LAVALVHLAEKQGAEVSDDGGLAAAGFSAQAVAAEHQNWWKLGLAILKKDGAGTLPVANFQLRLSLDDLNRPQELLEADLCEKTTRYVNAFEAGLIQLEDGRILSAYALIDSIISKRATHVVYPAAGNLASNQEVPLEAMVRALGGDAVDLEQSWFFPGIDHAAAEGRAKLNQLNEFLGVTPPVASESDEQEGMDETQIQLLLTSPYLVLLAVAGADGKVDAGEVKAFSNFLNKAGAAQKDGFTKILLLRALEQPGPYIALARETLERFGLPIFGHIVTLLEKASDDQGEALRRALYQLGESVAKASGGFFSKISAEEKQVLAILKQLLKLA
jgi:hypothetical protein